MGEKYTIARFTKGSDQFEILVKSEEALAYKMGQNIPISNIIVTDTIFIDVSKGTKASEEKLIKNFGTTDSLKIAEFILSKGTLQLTAEQRRRLIEDKKKQIVSYITRNCIDPKTGLPHPPLRIEQALQHVHYSVDINKSVEEQARDIIKLLRPILPLKVENVRVAIKIPPTYTAKAYGVVKGMGEIKKEVWKSDGSWIAMVEVPAGSYGPLLEKLGKLTHGNVESKLIK